MNPIAHMVANFLGEFILPDNAKPSPKIKPKKVKTRKPTQIDIYGEVIFQMRRDGYTHKEIKDRLGVAGTSTVLSRYLEMKELQGKK
jgi:hypothetical protein